MMTAWRSRLSQKHYHQRIVSKGDVQIDDRQFTAISKALADPNRFAMLRHVASQKDAPTCSCLIEKMGLAAATISHHLKELSNAGLVDVVKEGKFAHISLRRDVWQAYLKRLSAL